MKKFRYIIIALSVILTFSCGKILDPTIQGQVALDNLLSTQSGIITAVNGIYQPLQGVYQSQIVYLTSMAGDEGWTWRKETEPDIYILDLTSTVTQSIWSSHYDGITRANIVLNRIQQVTDFSSPEMKNATEGQAKFMRAFYYFNLVRFFGPVPLIMGEIKVRKDAELPRTAIKDIYIQIKKDLEDAIKMLPVKYLGGSGMEVGRPTSYTATALKALVHLELEEWNDAVNLSGAVMDKGKLLTNYADNFNGTQENGTGSFFEIQYGGVTGTTTSGLSSSFAPTEYSGGASPLPTDDTFNGKGGGLSSGNGFVQLFETGDLRKDITISGYGLANFIDPSKPKGSLYYVNKFYNTKDPRGLSTWNYPLIRYAEVLLTRAEALNEIGYIAGGEAFVFLNKTRINAGLAALTQAELPNQVAFRNALRKERKIELSFESKNYFDLNRWGILQQAIQFQMDYIKMTFPVNKLITHPITGKKYFLFPIPNIEFTNNANMGEQNPGY
ncbi:MAG: RagB/SusD family nutrient uptake outer membrane protein [Mariniphaga sp.]|nr:RagB/SusD family nutrient uptake outer membrane protein [Mariniphaga sp.]